MNNDNNLPIKSNTLSEEDIQLRISAEALGYKTIPVSIEQFIEDEYYLGNITGKGQLYKFWKERCKEIFPNPIVTSTPYLVITGAIGIGKSTFMRVLASYMMHRILCLKDPWKSMHLMPGKKLKMSFFSYKLELAVADFVDVLQGMWFNISPYFVDNAARIKEVFEIVADGPKTNSNIGSDVIFYNLSELNFIPHDKGKKKLDEAISRFTSRFKEMQDYFGILAIDTSCQGENAIADEWVNDNPFGELVRHIWCNQWTVKADRFDYDAEGWFDLYTGDSVNAPFIITDVKKFIPERMDAERLMKVPNSYRPLFENDLYGALQDQAGVSTKSTNRYMNDMSHLADAMCLELKSDECIKLDFNDKDDKLIYHLSDYLADMPKNRKLYISYDLGVATDYTGLSVAYFDGYKYYKNEVNTEDDIKDANKKIRKNKNIVRQPTIIAPITIGINRMDGQETPLYHLMEFIMDLRDLGYQIGGFSCDQFASRQMVQDLTREGFLAEVVSIDRDGEGHDRFKSLIYNGLIKCVNSTWLFNEIADLRWTGHKYDHAGTKEDKGKFRGRGYKDLSDSLVRCVYHLYKHLDDEEEFSAQQKYDSQITFIKKRKEEKDNEIQQQKNRLESMLYQGMYRNIF